MKPKFLPMLAIGILALAPFACAAQDGDESVDPPAPQKTEEPKPPEPEPKAKPAPTKAEDALTVLLQKVQQIKRSTRNFQAKLDFYEYSDAWGNKTTTAGSIVFQGRGSAEIRFVDKAGAETRYIEDGPFLWRYWPEKKIVEKHFYDGGGTVQTMLDILASPVLELKKRFEIRLGKAKQKGHGLATFAFLKADRKRAIESITVRFDTEGRPVAITLTEKNRDQRRWTLSDVQANLPELDAADLAFHPERIEGLKVKDFTKKIAPARVDRAILKLVRENAIWPYGWEGTVASSGSHRTYVVTAEGGFKVESRSSKEGPVLSSVVYDGKVLVRRAGADDARQPATAAQARGNLDTATRLALAAVVGELVGNPQDFVRLPAEDPQSPPSNAYILRPGVQGWQGIKNLQIVLARDRFQVAQILYETDGKTQSGGKQTLTLTAKPLIAPVMDPEVGGKPKPEPAEAP